MHILHVAVVVIVVAIVVVAVGIVVVRALLIIFLAPPAIVSVLLTCVFPLGVVVIDMSFCTSCGLNVSFVQFMIKFKKTFFVITRRPPPRPPRPLSLHPASFCALTRIGQH